MHTFSLLSTSVLLSALVAAAPHPLIDPFISSTSSSLDRRIMYGKPGGVYYCQGTGFSPPCEYNDRLIGSCFAVGNGFFLTINSFGPNPGGVCTIYEKDDCNSAKKNRGAELKLTFPGNMYLAGLGWGNRIKSYKCKGTMLKA